MALEPGEGGCFSLAAFSKAGVQAAHPLLPFRCLPNMPAFHISATFDVQGPCLVTYPGPGQLYLALDEAADAVSSGRLDRALVCAVAFQRNFLVRHHFSRLDPPVPADRLRDAAGCLVLEREATARARGAPGLCRLAELSLGYTPHPPFETGWPLDERFRSDGAAIEPPGALGPASLAVMLSLHRGTRALAVEYARKGIRFHCLRPGPTDTAMLQGALQLAEAEILGCIPLGRLGKPEEVAELALFLLSDRASFMTGGAPAVDGGYLTA